jgi:alpha-beta hydrolase superfamily lysophospholipase
MSLTLWAVSLGATPLAGVVLSLWPWRRARAEAGLDFAGVLAGRHQPLPVASLALRDGAQMAFRWVEGPPQGPLVVMLHGSGWHGQQFEGLAAGLADVADVVIPDLRGHGVAPQRRGDVDHIGQFEEDLDDLIAARARPGQKVILLGHSSGGGLVVRCAGGACRRWMDGAILLAPYLHHRAPTMRPASGGWTQVHLPRMIGLGILNALRIKVLNHLTVLRFAMPPAVLAGPLGATATVAYSYRLNASYAPRRTWRRDLAALPPFLLVAGQQDEAFVASRYQSVMSAENPDGHYVLLEGVGHLDVVDAKATQRAIFDYLGRFS